MLLKEIPSETGLARLVELRYTAGVSGKLSEIRKK
jgi:hypothetical protein